MTLSTLLWWCAVVVVATTTAVTSVRASPDPAHCELVSSARCESWVGTVENEQNFCGFPLKQQTCVEPDPQTGAIVPQPFVSTTEASFEKEKRDSLANHELCRALRHPYEWRNPHALDRCCPPVVSTKDEYCAAVLSQFGTCVNDEQCAFHEPKDKYYLPCFDDCLVCFNHTWCENHCSNDNPPPPLAEYRCAARLSSSCGSCADDAATRAPHAPLLLAIAVATLLATTLLTLRV